MDEKLKIELKNEIESIVATIFSEKEDADIRKKTEEALQESAEKIQELTICLEERNEEITTLNEKAAENEEKIQGFGSELEAAKKETDEANEKLTEAETALEEIKKDRATELRMTELVEAKVVDSDKVAQLAKVREMSDDEFATYRDERTALRQAVIDELAAASTEEETDKEAAEKEAAEKEAAEKEAAEKEAAEKKAAEEKGSEEDEDIPPAHIDPGQAVAAALNMEIIPTEDMVSKYAKLGKEMAARMIKKKEIEV